MLKVQYVKFGLFMSFVLVKAERTAAHNCRKSVKSQYNNKKSKTSTIY